MDRWEGVLAEVDVFLGSLDREWGAPAVSFDVPTARWAYRMSDSATLWKNNAYRDSGPSGDFTGAAAAYRAYLENRREEEGSVGRGEGWFGMNTDAALAAVRQGAMAYRPLNPDSRRMLTREEAARRVEWACGVGWLVRLPLQNKYVVRHLRNLFEAEAWECAVAGAVNGANPTLLRYAAALDPYVYGANLQGCEIQLAPGPVALREGVAANPAGVLEAFSLGRPWPVEYGWFLDMAPTDLKWEPRGNDWTLGVVYAVLAGDSVALVHAYAGRGRAPVEYVDAAFAFGVAALALPSEREPGAGIMEVLRAAAEVLAGAGPVTGLLGRIARASLEYGRLGRNGRHGAPGLAGFAACAGFPRIARIGGFRGGVSLLESARTLPELKRSLRVYERVLSGIDFPCGYGEGWYASGEELFGPEWGPLLLIENFHVPNPVWAPSSCEGCGPELVGFSPVSLSHELAADGLSRALGFLRNRGADAFRRAAACVTWLLARGPSYGVLNRVYAYVKRKSDDPVVQFILGTVSYRAPVFSEALCYGDYDRELEGWLRIQRPGGSYNGTFYYTVKHGVYAYAAGALARLRSEQIVYVRRHYADIAWAVTDRDRPSVGSEQECAAAAKARSFLGELSARLFLTALCSASGPESLLLIVRRARWFVAIFPEHYLAPVARIAGAGAARAYGWSHVEDGERVVLPVAGNVGALCEAAEDVDAHMQEWGIRTEAQYAGPSASSIPAAQERWSYEVSTQTMPASPHSPVSRPLELPS